LLGFKALDLANRFERAALAEETACPGGARACASEAANS